MQSFVALRCVLRKLAFNNNNKNNVTTACLQHVLNMLKHLQNISNKKAVLSQGDRAMSQLLFSV